MGKVAIVTGANKGIGYEIVRSLAGATEDLHIVVACRSAERGKAAIEKLKSEFPSGSFEFGKVDLADRSTLEAFAEHVRSTHASIDMVVHNAAIAFKNSDPTPFKDQARPTLDVNYFGTLALHQKLLPLVQGSIVFVASQVGTSAFKGCKAELKEKWKNAKSEEEVTALANKFVADVEAGEHRKAGWPNSCYGVSKLAVITLAKVEAEKNPNVVINSVCPGWCATDMSSNSGSRTAAKGAETPAFLAAFAKGQKTGEFWYDKKVISFL